MVKQTAGDEIVLHALQLLIDAIRCQWELAMVAIAPDRPSVTFMHSFMAATEYSDLSTSCVTSLLSATNCKPRFVINANCINLTKVYHPSDNVLRRSPGPQPCQI